MRKMTWLFIASIIIAIFSYTRIAAADSAELLEPRSFPYTLAVETETTVTFKVELINPTADPNPKYILLEQVNGPEPYKLNDSGKAGDLVAGDGIYGAAIIVSTKSYKPGDCLQYRASTIVGKGEPVSSIYNLCVTALPFRIAASNTKPENLIFTHQGTSPAVADELLVRFIPKTREQDIIEATSSVKSKIVGGIPTRLLYQLRFSSSLTLKQLKELIANLRKNPAVENAFLNRVGTPSSLPNDPEYLATNQHGYEWINADDAWDIGADGSGITIALLDSGGVETHPDLPIGGGADPGNHGTPMAGIAAALTDNGIGIASPAGNSTLLSFVLPSITFAEMVEGFNDISATPAKVVIAGFNFTMAPPAIDFGEAIDDQWDLCAEINNVVNGAGGAVVVSAAGNDDSDGWHYPSKCNDNSAPANAGLTAGNKNRLITVMGSVTCNGGCTPDTRQSDSNYGAWIDVVAPAQSLRSTNNAGGYSNFSGTSFAASLVGGVAAQMFSCGATVGQIQSRLISSAPASVAYPGGSKPRIDAYQAAVIAGNVSPTGINLAGSTSIDEGTDTGLGHVIGTLSAVDANICDTFTYSIQGGADAAAFSIGGPNMDQLILTDGVLDFETKSSYSVTVHLIDAEVNPFNQPFTITVNDLAENTAPVVGDQAFAIDENSVNGSTVGTVAATDGEGDVLNFSITAGNTGGAFAINPGTGEITVANSAALDFETTPSFALTVEVSDGALTDTATITVNLNDVNEAPTIGDEVFAIDENSANGTTVGTVSASDPDAATTLSYSITAGNTGGAFAINPGTGQLTVANSAALDFETTPSFALTVEVSDGALTDTATVTVNLNNVVENTAPVVNNQTFNINENSPNGSVVGTVVASDGEGDVLNFSITAGNTGGAFAINPGTGQLTVANSAALDFETTPSFALTVEVSDGVLTDTATITVNLNDLAETIPNPIIDWVLPVPYETYNDAFGDPYVRYRFQVTNLNAYPEEMFDEAPALPPCGLNANSSRTWVYIYNGVTNAYIYGFCALGTPQNLDLIWFAVPEGGTPPPSIYITLIDRLTSTVYTSNTLTVP